MVRLMMNSLICKANATRAAGESSVEYRHDNVWAMTYFVQAYFGHVLLWPRPTLATTYFGHGQADFGHEPLCLRTPCPGPPPSRTPLRRTSKITRFSSLSRPSFGFFFFQFPSISWNCGGVCAFSTLKMSSQHTFGLSKFVCCEDIFNDANTQRPPQCHEIPRKLEKNQKRVGRGEKKREMLAPTLQIPRFGPHPFGSPPFGPPPCRPLTL